MTKIIEPSFYPSFKCTAGDCPLTCCQEWRIWVDEDTEARWKDLSFCNRPLTEFITPDPDGGKIIDLQSNRTCPFLDRDRLCTLVKNYGDSVLSETCTVFPRQSHTYPDRLERALMAGCPAVVDLLADQLPFPEGLTEDSTLPTMNQVLDEDGYLTQAALHYIRSGILKLLMTEKNENKALMIAFYLLLELQEQYDQAMDSSIKSARKKLHKILPIFHSTSDYRHLSEMIDDMEFDWDATLQENMELFLDLCSNYLKEGRYQNFLEPLCSLAEEMLEDEDSSTDFTSLWDNFSPFWEECRPLFRHYLQQEVFASLLSPEGDYATMLVHFQWIVMSAIAIRQAIFLGWATNRSLSYEQVRECFCIISRMTGYNDEDIEEYLESMFEDLVWEWGYLALLVGC